jgi:mxaJ protein
VIPRARDRPVPGAAPHAAPAHRRRGVAAAVLLAAVVGSAGCTGEAAEASAPELRVCADPNNLPFSNDREEGYENQIAELVAREIGAELRYTWWAQRRGFIRNTLRAGVCDLVIGMPSALEHARSTRPYYRSTYVFVYPRDSGHDIRSFDDPRLHGLRVGVHVVGDDYASTPPVHALARRGIVDNVVGFSIFGDYREPDPPARILDALGAGEIDIAIVWGPLAGYFAPRQPAELEIVAVHPQIDLPFLPMVYDVSMGVRWEDTAFAHRLDSVLVSNQAEIRGILERFGVPRAEPTRAGARGAAEGSTP